MPGIERRRIAWAPILLEAVFIVLGILLALATDEWRQNASERRRTAEARASIREELAENRRAVLASATYHLYLSDTLGALSRTNRAGGAPVYPDGRLFSQGFFHPAQLLATAWETALATDATRHLPYEDVLALAHIYEQQRGYVHQSQMAGQLVYGRLFDQGFDGMVRNYANLNTVIGTFWYRECQLIDQYAGVLARLDGTAPDTTGVPARCRWAARR